MPAAFRGFVVVSGRCNRQVGLPLARGWPVLEVDTTRRVDVDAVAEPVQAAC